MSNGFFVRNLVDQSYQIDDTYRNVSLKAKGTFSPSSDTVPVTVNVTGVNPVLAVRSTGTNTPVILHSAQTTGTNSWAYRYIGKAGDTVFYYVFDEPTNANLAYAIIRNAAGQVMFNGAEEYLTPVQRLQYAWTPGNGNQQTALPAGRTYAGVALGGRIGVFRDGGGGGFQSYMEFGVGLYFSGTTAILEGKPTYQTVVAPGVPTPPVTPGIGRWLVLDVTGF